VDHDILKQEGKARKRGSRLREGTAERKDGEYVADETHYQMVYYTCSVFQIKSVDHSTETLFYVMQSLLFFLNLDLNFTKERRADKF
jgi:hypothetical protein